MAGITSNRVKIHFEDGKIIIHSGDAGGDAVSGNTDDQIRPDDQPAAKDHADIDEPADAEISESRDDLTDSGDE